MARHEITTNLEEICQVARHALKSNGRIAMVHRPDRFLDIIDTMRQYNLAPKRIQFIYPKMGREANMLLIEAIKDVSKLPKKRTKNRICFSYKLEKADVNYTRTLIKLINEKGYSFTRDADACNVFVCYDDEDSDKRKTCAMQVKKRDVVIMSVKDFEKQIGYTRNAEFNDKEFLAEYYETKL